MLDASTPELGGGGTTAICCRRGVVGELSCGGAFFGTTLDRIRSGQGVVGQKQEQQNSCAQSKPSHRVRCDGCWFVLLGFLLHESVTSP